MPTVSILLTKYSDWGSTLIYTLTGFGYTHASISLDDGSGRFYSFNYRGFAIESVEKHRHKGVNKSLLIQLQVSAQAYERLKKEIQHFCQHRNQYSYSRIGVVMAMLRIPLERKNRYFCSQFVAQLLVKSEAVALKRNVNSYLPNQFLKDLATCHSYHQAIYNVV